MKTQRNWMRLDNAAKIYPPSSRRGWSALFRLSAELTEEVSPEILADALRRTLKRVPAYSVRLRSGVFWLYFEHLDGIPEVAEDSFCPCPPLQLSRNQHFCFRVLYYRNRIAAEFFHVLTDGTGGLVFLKTLVAEYLTLKYGVVIERGNGILDCSVPPDPAESEDGFISNAGRVASTPPEPRAYRINGTPEQTGEVDIICGTFDADALLAAAHAKNASVTEYLTAAMIIAIDAVQRRETRNPARLKPVKICVPVNLRRFFPTKTLRNFAYFTNPGIDPRMGRFTFDEVISAVHHCMGAELTGKMLSARFTSNVRIERNMLLRITPLFLKNIAMKLAFNIKGDNKTCTTVSNLGHVTLPPAMAQYVTRMDFILGPLSHNPVACAVMSYGGKLRFNITRTIVEPKVEAEFFTFLRRQGLHVYIEANERQSNAIGKDEMPECHTV